MPHPSWQVQVLASGLVVLGVVSAMSEAQAARTQQVQVVIIVPRRASASSADAGAQELTTPKAVAEWAAASRNGTAVREHTSDLLRHGNRSTRLLTDTPRF